MPNKMGFLVCALQPRGSTECFPQQRPCRYTVYGIHTTLLRCVRNVLQLEYAHNWSNMAWAIYYTLLNSLWMHILYYTVHESKHGLMHFWVGVCFSRKCIVIFPVRCASAIDNCIANTSIWRMRYCASRNSSGEWVNYTVYIFPQFLKR